MCSDGAGFTKDFPGLTRHLTTLDIQFKIPFRRTILSAFGVIPASSRFITKLLSNKTRNGTSLANGTSGAKTLASGTNGTHMPSSGVYGITNRAVSANSTINLTSGTNGTINLVSGTNGITNLASNANGTPNFISGANAPKIPKQTQNPQPTGKAICLVVGGAEEALESHGNVYKLRLNDRKGFCRIALKTGSYLVPVYAFGETSGYRQVRNPIGSKLRDWQTKIKKVWGFSPVLAYGKDLIPGLPSVTPFEGEIVVVFGSPIPVTQLDDPTDEQVDQLHSLYKTKLVALFEEHKGNYGIPKNVQLSFY
ncbi:unnamed protein product [Bursaphelenchus okinawaensis]|uniref:Acyltransferase n=1 Tax=Bursaphelenchus okinawaensis TaxID=465554 RepID=A0A811KZE1_9BILA|nr:unnamed protein product [Bursaphelenchus okinawaensis]CAG9114804.1 unnamed protein product [Bursaphelenchus okinawaensis]